MNQIDKNPSPQVAAIIERYKSSLIEKAELINQHLRNLVNEESVQQSALEDANQDLHKLAGSSGMYGYVDVSDLARLAMRNIADNDLKNLELSLLQLRNLLQAHG